MVGEETVTTHSIQIHAGEEAVIKKAIACASHYLSRNGLVALPTETVYGLAAKATDSRAVLRLYQTKSRPRFNPLILHVSNRQQAEHYVVFSDLARKLADAFWPGPLTLVLPKKKQTPLSDLVSAGLDHLAVRVPDHDFTKRLLADLPWPLVAPSANLSGKISATSAEQVHKSLTGKIELILDGGKCRIGLESTILAVPDTHHIYLLRPGGLTRKKIEEQAKLPVLLPNTEEKKAPLSPGRLKNHYAPNAPLLFNIPQKHMSIIRKKNKQMRPAFLTFGNPDLFSDLPAEPYQINLSQKGCVEEAAHNLFKALARLDALKPDEIYVSAIPKNGLGEAINDRLRRAAQYDFQKRV